jgi:hypothetical protein
LELIFVLADTLAFQDDYSNEFRVVECTIEPSSAIEAVKQDRHVLLLFAGRPAVDIVMLWSEHQGSVLEMIDVVYHLTSVDIPDSLDFFAEQFPAGYHGRLPLHAVSLTSAAAARPSRISRRAQCSRLLSFR